ncbi:YccT family protein [Vibrio nomapromontoriensis]|uniref:YccT family protein n=1 Tax=Vibrio nomapromontoriensis TaxID=2910246 RepID=UPI003D0E116D
MKNSMVVLATLGLAFSVNAATLVPMKGVSVYFINGQEADSRIGKNELEQGENQVVVRMDKKLGKGSSSNVYTSAPYVLTVNVTGDEVKINHPVARSEQEAKVAFRGDTPQWRVTQDGYALAYEQEKLKGKDGFMPYMQMDELIAAHNAERGITFTSGEMVVATSAAPVATVAATTAVAATVADTPKVSATAASKEAVAPQVSDNVGQLQAWYLKASKQERKEFRKWMIDQE